MTTIDDEVAFYAIEGHDRDVTHAILAQARHRADPIDDVQVRHLLAIGYRAGRAASEAMLDEAQARAAFDRVDAQLSRWAILAGGVAAGAMLTGLLTWLFG